jgi:hypothetical protein
MQNVLTQVKAGRLSTLEAMDRVEAEETKIATRARARGILGWLGVAAVAGAVLFARIAFGNTPPLDQLPSVAAAPSQAVVDWTQIILAVIGGIGAILGTILTTVLLPAARQWLIAKRDDANASTGTKLLIGASLKLDGFIEAGIAQVWHVFDADLKAARAPDSDGGATVTPAELEKAKADVLLEVKNYLGTAGLAQLQGVLGFGGELLNSYLKAQIEKKVQAAQEAGSIAAAGVTTGQQAAAALSKL